MLVQYSSNYFPTTFHSTNTNFSHSFSYKLGKNAAKITHYFKKKETKVRTLITYWAIETVLFALIFVSLTSIFSFLSALFLYVYGTYAIFSAVEALSM